jgi:cell wall-associated NlpC family hydrolase
VRASRSWGVLGLGALAAAAVILSLAASPTPLLEPTLPDQTPLAAAQVGAQASDSDSAKALPDPSQGDPRDYGSMQILLTLRAIDYLGTPYSYASQSKKGIDCSGFVQIVLKLALGLKAPRSSADYVAWGHDFSGDIEPGDVILFSDSGRVSHVGLATGSGFFIHAASAGPSRGVIVSSLAERYYRGFYFGKRRILDTLGPAEAIVAEPGFGE